jgi:phospholipase C
MEYRRARRALLVCTAASALLANSVSASFAAVQLGANDGNTSTPIKHVIVIVGENRTFDQVFATYKPRHGQTVWNLLSQGIVNADGTPGPNFGKALQFQASDTTKYSISPTLADPYKTLPPPNTGFTPPAQSLSSPPFPSVDYAAQVDYGLFPSDLVKLTTGASHLPYHVIDRRIANVTNLPPGPFQLTPGVSYDAYANSPVHRFYQMWQQMDCSASYAQPWNPSGCKADLFPWVEVTVGAGTNGKTQPANFTDETTGEGATAMGFYNVQQGDMPYFTALANQYTIADNYHQPVMGGTGANSIMLGTADAIYYTDGKGNAATPPSNQIENPDPQPGTNNWYTQDGYSGGSYTDCSDLTHPAVASIRTYLAKLPWHPNAKCAPGHYYLLNNYNPGYLGNGTVAPTSGPNGNPFTIPPSPVPTIADRLIQGKVSWAYFGEGWNDYVFDPNSPIGSLYCNICNPFQYETRIMTNETIRDESLKDTTDLYNDIQDGVLPAVSYVKPDGLNDGHPESSKYDIFEAFVRKILTELQRQPALWASTAVFITNDEGGGYYDSGYVQPLDYFGDGTRIPLLVVSPFSRGGRVVHSYTDHASIPKFIEANWNLKPITGRSRDNLPNPVTSDNPYVPTNSPAIGDLMDMFTFSTP